MEHPDFGKAFSCQCRNTAENQQKRLSLYADLPKIVRTFNSFEPLPGTEEALQAAKDFATGDPGYSGLTLAGQFGNGKSFLLQAIGWEMLEQGYTVKYVCVGDLLQKLRDTFDAESQASFAHIWDSYDRATVLLLDDITENPRPTPWAQGQIERLVDKRYREGNPWVVTTNLTLDTMAETWGWRLADRLFDEGSGIVRVVYNLGKSYRTGR